MALEILKDATASLSRYVTGVYNQLFLNAETVQIVAVGGVFKSHKLMQLLMQDIYSSISCPLGSPQLSPAAGALLEALRQDANSSSLAGLQPGD